MRDETDPGPDAAQREREMREHEREAREREPEETVGSDTTSAGPAGPVSPEDRGEDSPRALSAYREEATRRRESAGRRRAPLRQDG